MQLLYCIIILAGWFKLNVTSLEASYILSLKQKDKVECGNLQPPKWAEASHFQR